MEAVHQFRFLFDGRRDAWGGDAGVARPLDFSDNTEHYKLYRGHLMLGDRIGVYPLMDDGTVKWGCVDIDYDDKPEAANLWKTLLTLKIPSWIEVSRRKGFHVWVFAEDWVPASTMREALLVACKVAGVPPKEVNPKQTDLKALKLGNYVRLPYGGHLGPKARRCERQYMVPPDSDEPIPLEQFVHYASEHCVSLKALQDAASLLPPVPASEVRIVEPSTLDGKKIPALAKTILDEGPLEGADRSGTLVKLAMVLRDGKPEFGVQGLSPGECLSYVRDADARWGKFHGRHDCEDQLRKIVERVYR